jgi:hypothetical protein
MGSKKSSRKKGDAPPAALTSTATNLIPRTPKRNTRSTAKAADEGTTELGKKGAPKLLTHMV